MYVAVDLESGDINEHVLGVTIRKLRTSGVSDTICSRADGTYSSVSSVCMTYIQISAPAV